jgi:hypothetical protein
MIEPDTPRPFTRATYCNISTDHFTWRGEHPNDNKTWQEFMVIECERIVA